MASEESDIPRSSQEGKVLVQNTCMTCKNQFWTEDLPLNVPVACPYCESRFNSYTITGQD